MHKDLGEIRQKLKFISPDLLSAALFSPPAQRRATTALLAVYTEIRGILRECSDAGVARTKLAWWQEELELLSAHHPRHPLCKTLDEQLGGRALPTQTFFDITAGVSTDIGAVAFEHYEDVERYCYQRGGALTELAAQLDGPQPPGTLYAARLLGQSWQLADIVFNGSEYARHGRNYFAADDLRRYSIDPQAVIQQRANPRVQTLLKDYAQRTTAQYTSASVLANVNWSKLACALVLAGLARARLKKFTARTHTPAVAPVELGAFTQLWIAWRSARRALRSRRPLS